MSAGLDPIASPTDPAGSLGAPRCESDVTPYYASHFVIRTGKYWGG